MPASEAAPKRKGSRKAQSVQEESASVAPTTPKERHQEERYRNVLADENRFRSFSSSDGSSNYTDERSSEAKPLNLISDRQSRRDFAPLAYRSSRANASPPETPKKTKDKSKSVASHPVKPKGDMFWACTCNELGLETTLVIASWLSSQV